MSDAQKPRQCFPKHSDKIYIFIQVRKGVIHIWHSEKEREGKRFAKKGPLYIGMYGFMLGWNTEVRK